MRSFFWLMGLTAFAIGGIAYAQDAGIDSSKVYSMRGVTITSTRSEIQQADSPSSVSLLTLEAMSSINGSTVADVLENGSTVFVKNYGGNSTLRTVSLRGGASEHVLVLVDGNRMNSFQNGLVDLSLFSSSNIDRIEILRGGSSALYGADALGGVINILTKLPSGGIHSTLEAAGGSFGYQKSHIDVQAGTAVAAIRLGLLTERGKDDFPFSSSPPVNGIEERRNNSDFFRRQFSLSGSASLLDDTQLMLGGEYVKALRGVPGPYFGSGVVSDARQNDDDVRLRFQIDHQASERLVISTAGNFHYNFQTYDDPDPVYPIQSLYRNLYGSINPQVRFDVGEHRRVIAGAEFSQGLLDGNDFDSDITRVQKAAYVSGEIRFETDDRETFNRLTVYPMVRYDHITDVDEAFTPKLGANLRISREGDIRMRSSVGRSFRSPSFNDLYYRGFSNPNLQPELSTTFDMGLSWIAKLIGRHTFDVSYFFHDTRDRILFDLVQFIPVNVGRVHSSGIEVEYAFTFDQDRFGAEVHYAHTKARKKNSSGAGDPTFNKLLPYLPQDILTVSGRATIKPVVIGFQQSFIGERFSREDNSTSVPAYWISNLNASTSLRLMELVIMMKAEVSNILARSYEVFQDYPMPGRSYRVSLGVEY